MTRPLSNLRYDDASRSITSTLISYFLTINSPTIVQMTSNFAQAGCTLTCEMIFAPCSANLFEIFKKIMQKLKFRIPFVKHVYVTKSLSASCKERDGVMAHHIVTTKHNLNQPKSCIHYAQTTLVNRSLTKVLKIHN